jgi:hypothetical protein
MNPLEVWWLIAPRIARGRVTTICCRDARWHPRARADPVRAWRLTGVRVTADIIPCTRSEFEEEKHEIDSLPRAATLRGRKIYER